MVMKVTYGYYFCLTIVIFLQSQFLSTVHAIDHSVITVKSNYSVKETIDHIEADIKRQNGTVFVRIDQKKAAEQAGIVGQLDDTEVILFGNPAVGTQLMVENGAVSIELPIRASCWKKNNDVYLSVVNPASLEVPYNLGSKKVVLQRMTDNIMEMISKVSS